MFFYFIREKMKLDFVFKIFYDVILWIIVFDKIKWEGINKN